MKSYVVGEQGTSNEYHNIIFLQRIWEKHEYHDIMFLQRIWE